MEKDNIQKTLLDIGRKLVQERGMEHLTARKLSEASGCSVGAIYNQFSNMDNFIVVLNCMTLDDLLQHLETVPLTDDAHVDMNNLAHCFSDFVLHNKNLWFMLYNFYLRSDKREYSYAYLRKIVRIISIVSRVLQRTLPTMEYPERILSSQILWLTLFALSPFLANDTLNTTSKVNSEMLCQVVLNTFVAGLTVLESK